MVYEISIHKAKLRVNIKVSSVLNLDLLIKLIAAKVLVHILQGKKKVQN